MIVDELPSGRVDRNPRQTAELLKFRGDRARREVC
jgi:hypothetical protein